MKIALLAFLTLACSFQTFAQVGIGTAQPHNSAILDISSNDKGVLMPRVTSTQKLAIENPADGLLVYDTEESRFFHFNAKTSSWERISNQNDSGNGTSGNTKPKNVIFMIGDGMGYPQIYAPYARDKKILTLTQFPYAGTVQTFSADNFTTDSAAGATALSSGVKTKNGYVGVDPSGNPVTSIMTEAKNRGLSTGIVVTSPVNHATPAGFYGHNTDRFNYTALAKDFITSGIDVCIGGGKSYFSSSDLSQLQAKGYEITYTLSSTLSSSSQKILGLLANDMMPKISEGRGDMLSRATEKALSILKTNEKGFFLMIEGSQIDKGGEARDINYTINEMIDFDNAIKVAKDFAELDGNTLIVVTADHETGGLIIYGNSQFYYTATVNGAHTGVPVPVFSYGPGADKFTGYLNNTDFKNKFMGLLF